jgi:hypothetical protein
VTDEVHYVGPFVVLEPDAMGYCVRIEPSVGNRATRTFRGKHEAWGYARDLWTELGLLFRDLTDSNVRRD